MATADAIVGDVLEHLRSLGLCEKAIVVVTSDHGEGLGEHGEEQHLLLLYREAIQVPLLVKLPGSRGGGSRVAAPVQLSDILPTVTASLGPPTPAGVSGTSLFAAGAKGAAVRTIYGETLYPRLQLGWADLRSVLDDRWHYIHGPRPELYDLVADPGEKTDLVKPERATAANFARALLRFPQGNEKPAQEDEETLKRLAALGYVGGLRERAGGADLPNPVDHRADLRQMEEGWHLAGIGQTERAIEHLTVMVAENPGMSEAWIKLGELQADAGRDEEAAAAYRQALDRSPVPLPDIAISLGIVELRRKRFDEAERLARLALAGLPAKGHTLLSRIALARMNRVDEAEAAFRAEIAAFPSNSQPFVSLAVLRFLKGDRPDVDRVLEEMYRAAPTPRTALLAASPRPSSCLGSSEKNRSTSGGTEVNRTRPTDGESVGAGRAFP